MLKYIQHVRTTTDLLAPFRRRILSDNRLDDTLALPTYEDGEPTVELQPIIETTTELPVVKERQTARELMYYVFGSRLVRWPLIGNGFVILAGVGLLIGSYLAAMEAGVLPDSAPGVSRSDPKPSPSKESAQKERSSSATPSPSDWAPVATPAVAPSSKKHPSSEASASPSASASTSPSASASVPAPTEASPSATTPTSPETTAPAVTPSASAPGPTESSTEGEPTSPASDTATPPTGETGSASPEDTAETPVNP